MKELGGNAATMPVFTWAHLQSAEGSYHFEWLDQVLNLLAENAIGGSQVSGTIKLPPKRVNILVGLD